MAKVIFSMTAGVPHGDDYVQPTGDTPISLGELEGKAECGVCSRSSGPTALWLVDHAIRDSA